MIVVSVPILNAPDIFSLLRISVFSKPGLCVIVSID